jgi:hypothetical protein
MAIDDEGWMWYLSDTLPGPRKDLVLQFENSDGRFIAQAKDFDPCFNVGGLRWRLTGIAKHQLGQL